MQEHVARNGDEEIRFAGELLGSASTHERGSLRWTELRVYKTRAGKYIVEKVGRTLVFHLDGEDCSSGIPVQYNRISEDRIQCPKCRPDDRDGNDMRLETDRFTTHVAETAKGAVAATMLRDEQDDIVFMPNVARRALGEASEKDEAIRDAFLVRRVD